MSTDGVIMCSTLVDKFTFYSCFFFFTCIFGASLTFTVPLFFVAVLFFIFSFFLSSLPVSSPPSTFGGFLGLGVCRCVLCYEDAL